MICYRLCSLLNKPLRHRCRVVFSPSLRFFGDLKDDGERPVPPAPKPVKSEKYSKFRDEDALTIIDVEEEKLKKRQSAEADNFAQLEEEKEEVYERGKTGVFDIEELVELLKGQKAEDIFVTTLPKELNYVSYLVVVTGMSRRHILALGTYVRRMFKKKKYETERIPKLEGENSDWVALDLGNIALHVMSSKAREMYDLESLWGVGAKYDLISNQAESEILQLLKKHSVSLDDLEPARNN